MISKQKVQDALNKCFGHDFVYHGYIQVFPNSIYHIDGKKVLELYEELELTNEKT